MKYTIFTDLHGSEEGLAKLLKHPQFPVGQKICLGDAIGLEENYQAYFQKVYDLTDVILLGNHEAVLIGKCDLSNFTNVSVHGSISDRKEYLEANEPQFLDALKQLPAQKIIAGAAFVHGSFNSQEPWRHIRYIEDLQEESKYLPKKLNFMGHGHIPFIAWLDKDGLWYYQRQIYGKTFSLNPDLTYIINAGSILGSREMRRKERTFLVFDSDKLTVNFYNIND